MTTVINQPNCDGGSFQPLTLIRAEEMNDELDTIQDDLIYISSALQTMADKLDTIDEGAGVTPEPNEIITLINAGTAVINASRIASDISSNSDVATAIANHRVTTNATYMHPETSIKSTELTYSSTPTGFVSSPANLLDEIKNLRYQVHKLLGKTTWVDTPTETLTQISSALDVVEAKLAGIETGATADQNAQEIVSLINASAYLIDDNNIAATIARDSEVTAAINAHVAASNPHNITKTTVGLTNVTNDAQLKVSQLETGAGINGLATYVPSSYSVRAAINGVLKNPTFLKNDTVEGGECSWQTGNASSYPSYNGIDRNGDNLRILGTGNGKTKCINIPQTSCISGISFTQSLMSVGQIDESKTTTNNYWSSTAASSVQNSIAGPIMVTGGIVSRSNSYGFVEWSTNGSSWNAFAVTDMAGTPSNGNNNSQMGSIPCVYVPAGTTLYLRAGSTFSGSYSSATYGGAYQMHYVRI